MNFHPIVTPYGRLTIVPPDMPVYNPHDIPNAIIRLTRHDGADESTDLMLPYKITGMNRTNVNSQRVVHALTGLVNAQIESREFVAVYGQCSLGSKNRQLARVGAALQQSLPGRTGIHYRIMDPAAKDREVRNYLVCAVVNGVEFRTWPDEEEYKSKTNNAVRTEIHGTCQIFGRKTRCTLKHDFFSLDLFSPEKWEEVTMKRVNEYFPFLYGTGLFSDLMFSVG